MFSTGTAIRLSSASNTTSTNCVRICASTTVPIPSGVVTRAFIFGSRFRSVSYVSSSYRRQHISLPQRPLIFKGSSVAFWIFADFMLMGLSTFRNCLQQQCCPHFS